MSAILACGVPYVALSTAMQAFYARRGMWVEGRPAGMLATWIGERCPWRPPARTVQHWTTHEGLAALAADAAAAPPQAWSTYHQKAQFLRRLREAAVRAGERPAAPAATDAPPAVAPRAPAAPFEPLRIPHEGTYARAAFERHLMVTLREFVVFTQGSEYALGGDAGAAGGGTST